MITDKLFGPGPAKDLMNKKLEMIEEVFFNGKYLGDFSLQPTGSYVFFPDEDSLAGWSEGGTKYILDKLLELNKEINDAGTSEEQLIPEDMGNFGYTPVALVTDDDGDNYIIPLDKKDRWYELQDTAEEFGWDGVEEEFNKEFSQYRTGGDWNKQFYIKGKL